ncbi:helix-turn-helix domain-containing protein [Vibrio sp. ER1A]|uniref:helix-turn-helix domain-containing protein n=1 Tax=Vibrio sp. ER1A TaxID=1517681 RepID=UPI00068A5673|nr:helix-turn-helix domain-containing protein [Vibrio sp. ER1A]
MCFLRTAQALRFKLNNPARKLILVSLSDLANPQTGECYPSYDYLADVANVSRRTAMRHVDDLEKLGFISVIRRKTSSNKNNSNLYKINFGGDIVTPQQSFSGDNMTPPSDNSDNFDGDTVSPNPTTLDPTTEQDLTSENKFSDDDMKLARFIFSRIKEVTQYVKFNPNKWADAIRLMRERDDLTHKEIQDVFIFANKDSFWRKNILSPTKLRDKFPQLDAARKENFQKPDGYAYAQRQQTEIHRGIEYGEFADQSIFPDELQLATNEIPAVRESVIAMRRTYIEQHYDEILAKNGGAVREDLGNDEWQGSE